MFYFTRKILSFPLSSVTFSFLPIALSLDMATLPFQLLLSVRQLGMQTSDLKIIEAYTESGRQHLKLAHKESNSYNRLAINNLTISTGIEFLGKKHITVKSPRGTSTGFTFFNSDHEVDHYVEDLPRNQP